MARRWPGLGLGGSRIVAAGLAVALVGCGQDVSVPRLGGPIPRCEDVRPIEAAAALYRDAPIYVANEMPTDAVGAWAQARPGFVGVWIDRTHHGWVTVAFNGDVATRQAELAAAFPGEGVVAVSVDWTMAELEALQQRVIRDGRPLVTGSGIRTNYGVVSIFAGVLTAETISTIQSKFGGLRVCLDGIDPADAPAEGPQLPSGDGWRLLGDQDETGGPYRTGIAADSAGYEALWATVGMSGDPPPVDFETEVVVWFGAVHGSSCPRLRLDGVSVDAEHALLYADITSFMLGACTADAIGHAYLVAIERAKLPKGRFTIQLEAGERPAGVIADELTIVDADLTVPGAALAAGQLQSASPGIEEARVEPGGFIEPGYPSRFRLSVRCGIEWLGEINGTWWRTAAGAAVPPAWETSVDADGTVDLELLLRLEPETRIEATGGTQTVTYRPSASPAPPCP